MRYLCLAAFAVLLAGCGGSSEPAAATPDDYAALTTELPALTGDHVWDMIEAESAVSFEAYYNGDFTGRFGRFQTAILLDPAAPETGEIHAIIDLASVQTKDDDVQANLPMADWFNVSDYPLARFTSTNISLASEGQYQADGALTIKGFSKPTTLAFSLDVEGGTASASGRVEISRKDFDIGSGTDFANEDWVKFPVAVTVKIKAQQ